jgi:hypothetical protein
MRKLVFIPFLAILLIAPATAVAKTNGYCSPSGDICQQVRGTEKRPIFVLSTFSLRGDVTVTVRTPAGDSNSHDFPLRKGKYGIYTSKVRWYKHYPHAGSGTYKVSWKQGETKLGKTLSFKIP